MATIVNHRDVLLQAAAERLIPITLGDNILVPAVRAVQLTAPSLTFQVSTAGVASPASITLTAALKHLTGVPAFSVVAGSAGLTGSGSTRALAYTDMLSDSVTIRASLTFEGELYSSEVTIAKVRDGANAQSILESFVFIRSASAPATPTGGSFASPVPTSSPAWSDGIPAGTLPVYMSTRKFTSDGLSPQAATWAAPALTSSIGQGAKVQFSVDGVTGWHDTPSVGDQYMRTGTSTDGGVSWTYAGAVKIKGETGSAGTPGQRGPTNVTYTVSGLSAWSDVQAEAALTANGYVKVLMDRVTLRNSSSNPTYIETRYWSGFSWLNVGVEINGNLLVSGTVTSDKFAANAVWTQDLKIEYSGFKYSGNVTLTRPDGTVVSGTSPSVARWTATPGGLYTIGHVGSVEGNGFYNVGVQGQASGGTNAVGVFGYAVTGVSGTWAYGGVFWGEDADVFLTGSGRIRWNAPGGGYITLLPPDGSTVKFARANGEWATLFDGTAPAALGSASAGASLLAARRDHVHQMPTAAQVGAAEVSHTHSGYATSSDISAAITANNSAYVSPNFALISHTHSAYALTSHTHAEYALTSHTHSGYALTSHTHSGYQTADGAILKYVPDPGGGTALLGYIGLQRTDGVGGPVRIAVYG